MTAHAGIRTRFEDMASRLRDDRRIEVRSYELPGPASSDDLEAASAALGASLPPVLEQLYAQMDGFVLEWIVRDRDGAGDSADRGSIEILPVARAFGDWHGAIWFDDRDDPFRWVRPLDFFAPEACAALVAPQGEDPRDAVHYHYLGEMLFDTGHDIAAFIDRLLVARGYWYWITALCPQLRAAPEAQDFLHRMPQLFDDFDASLFAPAAGAA